MQSGLAYGESSSPVLPPEMRDSIRLFTVDKYSRMSYTIDTGVAIHSVQRRYGVFKPPIPEHRESVKNPKGGGKKLPPPFAIQRQRDDNMTFEKRVLTAAITYAPQFKAVFIDCEYLICSKAFSGNGYYIIEAFDNNYLHLIGVNPINLSASDFFNKCIAMTLTCQDFDFNKKGRSVAEVKSSVKRKISAFPFYLSMTTTDLVAQESFVKNNIICAFAATDANMTVGYKNLTKAIPQSLMRGDTINWSKAEPVDLILRRPHGTDIFTDIVYGDAEALAKYKPQIKNIVDSNLFLSKSL